MQDKKNSNKKDIGHDMNMPAGHPAGVGMPAGHPAGVGMPAGHPHAVRMQGDEASGEFAGFRTVKKEEALEKFFAKESDAPLYEAFEKKVALHPGMGGMPIMEGKEKIIEELLTQPRVGNSIAYIHVPFCESHCIYCGFYNKAYKKDSSKEYTDALIQELSLWQGTAFQESAPIHALYFGGGTPSALEASDLQRIFKAVREILPLANDCEITFEARVYNFGMDKIEVCMEGGVNRFSLGVQSFDTELRRSMGRLASQEDIIERIEQLQSFNQSAIVFDLIYGFPNQTMDMWKKDIEIAKSLYVDGIDCYQLKTFKDSLLDKAIIKGQFPPPATLHEQADFYLECVNQFEQALYTRLSSEHWGRTSRERNIYNQFARTAPHSLAFGPGAGGSLHGHMYMIRSNYEDWLAQVKQGIKPIAMMLKPQAHYALTKRITLDLYHGAMNLVDIEKHYGIPVTKIFAPLLNQWEKSGLLVQNSGTIRLTTAGEFWQVNICQFLIDYLSIVSK